MQVLIAIITAFFQFMPFIGPGDAQAAGQALAKQARYTVYPIADTENSSVLISIPLNEEQFLQLYSPPVLRAFTQAALKEQASAIPKGARISFLLMDADHITGEARLHLIGYLLTHLAGGEAGLFAPLHERFRVSELNVNEARVPPLLIDVMGWLENFWSFLPV